MEAPFCSKELIYRIERTARNRTAGDHQGNHHIEKQQNRWKLQQPQQQQQVAQHLICSDTNIKAMIV